jgi:hypothetical protein
MKRVLTAPVQIWQLVLVSVLVASLTSTAVVIAAPLTSGFQPAGSMLMGLVSATDATMVTVPAGYTNVVVLQKTIVVPPHKVADLAVFGEVDIEGGASSGYQYCFGQYLLDDPNSGTQLHPGNYILEGFNPPANNLSVPINAFLTQVKPGTHTVYMVMQAGYANCYALDRSMIILANVH